tara:strand:- start:6869 stop:9367 length:2499 start_codon:yes stop_codon:yes gene_type:complete
MILVIVESPAKAKTINKYLGKEYKVLASMGHVRDLPPKSGSIKPDNEFEMLWQINSSRSKTINEINKEVKTADKIILATDPDREGEAISWHLYELFKSKGIIKDKAIERVAFNAVTKHTILEAIKNPRNIDIDLVEAYKARLSLDYLIGFTISPVLWKKLPGAKSAGRVQSVALRLVCQREIEIENFKTQEYWTIHTKFKSKNNTMFSSRLIKREGKQLGKFDIQSENEAQTIINNLKSSTYKVVDIKKTDIQRRPQPPFTTSTLQQEASKKLGLNPTITMQIAQRLYEGIDGAGLDGGLITYMRTDGVQIDDNIIGNIRETIVNKYGQEQLPEKKNIYKTKSKNAQESHEAIRPTSFANEPEKLKSVLNDDQFKLYDLIWKRTVASQMNNAKFQRISIDINATDTLGIENTFRTTTQSRVFPGYLSVFDDMIDEKTDTADDLGTGQIEQNQSIKVDKNEILEVDGSENIKHNTEPPPRYNPASLIKTLEELGIGRPSTYANILSKLSERNYTTLEQRRIQPTSNGRLVTAFLENYYKDYVEYDFTADLEEKLDNISNGDYSRLSLLENFWSNLDSTTTNINDVSRKEVVEVLNESLAPYIFNQELDDPRACPDCSNGKLTLLSFKEGSFVGCTNYPDCKYQRNLSEKNKTVVLNQIIAIDPISGKNILLQNGRYGPYLELEDSDAAPKRTSVPKGVSLDEITESLAISLISLPRTVGVNPDTNQEIISALGRYGPYIKHENTYVNLKDYEELFTIGLNRAISLIDEKNKRSPNKTMQLIGKHKKTNDEIVLMEGKYGPYLKYQKKNYSIPKNIKIEDLDLDISIELIENKK